MNKRKKMLQRKLHNGIITVIILTLAILFNSMICLKVVQAEQMNVEEKYTIVPTKNKLNTAEMLKETFKVEEITESKIQFEYDSLLPEENEQITPKEQKTSIHECEKLELIEEEELNEEEITMLAEVMWAEAEEYIKLPEEEAEEIFKLVGSVVINRRNDQKYFSKVNTIEEVIYAPGQYAQRTKNMIGKGGYDEKVYEWAKELIKDGPIGPSNMLYADNRTHGDGIYKEIGNGKFYFCVKG